MIFQCNLRSKVKNTKINTDKEHTDNGNFRKGMVFFSSTSTSK